MDSLSFYFNCTPEFNYLNSFYCGTLAAGSNFSASQGNGDIFVLVYVKEGKGVFNINDKSYKLNRGCSFIIYPGYDYSYLPDKNDPWKYCWFEIHGEILHSMLQLSEMTIDYPVHEYLNPETIDTIVNDIITKYSADNLQCELQRISLLHQIFTEIVNDISVTTSQMPLLEHVQSNRYISKAISYIADNYSKGITVNSIADYVGLDRSYFCRLFKKIISKTPSSYLISYRMAKARYFYMHTNYNPDEIAKLVGFKNADYLKF